MTAGEVEIAVNVTGLAQIREEAEHIARQMQAQTGDTIGFDLACLSRLDAVLDEWISMASVYDAVDDRAVESVTTPIASYVGEVLVRSGLAHWETWDDETPDSPVLALKTGQKLDVVESVRLVLRGLAPPAFARLASEIEQNTAGDDSPS